MEVVVTNGAIGQAQLQSNSYHQQTTQLFTWRDALPVTQPAVSEHSRESGIHYLTVLNVSN